MPLALDPNETADAVLPADETRPAESRPSFQVRFLTCRELSRYLKLIAEARAEKDNDAGSAKLDPALAMALVGWKNIVDRAGAPIQFSLDRLDDVLTLGEKWRLASTIIPSRVLLSEKESKPSGSSSPGDGEPSAKDAGAADAPTSPPPSSL